MPSPELTKKLSGITGISDVNLPPFTTQILDQPADGPDLEFMEALNRLKVRFVDAPGDSREYLDWAREKLGGDKRKILNVGGTLLRNWTKVENAYNTLNPNNPFNPSQ